MTPTEDWADAVLSPETLIIGPTDGGGGPGPGVPEPASWALMILGLGGVGAALRGRRRVAPSAAG